MKIGLLGYGTIGKGVYKIFNTLKERYNLEMVSIFDLPSKKEELGDLLKTDVDEIVNNDEIEVVIEALGGHDLPYSAIRKCLINGKSVITSNKEVVSLHLSEFLSLAHENGVSFLFEASVGGGIPIIRNLIDNVKINDVNHIYGIINGTTNYILTKMQNEAYTFEDALKLAKANGFAEANPTADIEGLDMVRKICILASIAYQGNIDMKDIIHHGIGQINLEIMKDIKEKNYVLKFIAESNRNGNEVSISVEPVLISSYHPLASVNDEFNAIIFKGSQNDVLEFYGKGAGSLPTASAVIADLIAIIENRGYIELSSENKFFVNQKQELKRYYVVKDGKSTIENVDNQASLKDAAFFARIMD